MVEGTRRLAAIVAADVVGYSRLVSTDEEGTLASLQAHRRELIDPKIAEYHGRIANTAGDSILIEFSSVVEAMRCVIDVQREMAVRNDDVPPDRRIEFRIGVNLGDVFVQGGDLLGDGVNVAARLEALASPGGICLSRAARDQIRDRMEIDLEDMGEVEVKNIARPVRAFRVMSSSATQAQPAGAVARQRSLASAWRIGAAGALAILLLAAGALVWLEPWTSRVQAASVKEMQLPLPDKPSVAVLPFDVTSSGEGDRAFADAVNEDLTRGLARVSGLFVIARGSTLSYTGEKAVPARVAEELGVRFVVRASLRKASQRVRVDAELVDALSGRIVWTDRFDRAWGDLFALQDELVQSLVSRIAQDLSKAGDFRRYTDDVEAYFAWFEGDRESWLNTPTSFGKARALARRALERDPGFVRAQSLLAFVETQTAYFKLVDNVHETLRVARQAAADAVALHPDDWYTQSVHAQSLMNMRDYEGAVVAFERAIALDPANAALLTRSSLPLIFLGRGAEAEERLRVVVRLNPFHDWLPDQLLGQALFLEENYEEAARRLAVAQQKNPRFIGNMWWRASTYGQLGDTEKAHEATEEILARMPEATISQSFIKISDVSAMERFREGLRIAGLPE